MWNDDDEITNVLKQFAQGMRALVEQSTAQSSTPNLHHVIQEQTHGEKAQSLRRIEQSKAQSTKHKAQSTKHKAQPNTHQPNVERTNNMTHPIFVPTKKHERLIKSQADTTLKNKTQQYDILLKQASQILADQQFWYIDNKAMIYDSTTGILWDANPDLSKTYNFSNYSSALPRCIGTLEFNQLPDYEQFYDVVKSKFPLKEGNQLRVKNIQCWLLKDGDHINLNSNPPDWFGTSYNTYRFLAINTDFCKLSLAQFLVECAQRRWTIHQPHISQSQEHDKLKQFLNYFHEYQNYKKQEPATLPIEQIWEKVDFISSRLDILDELRFTDLDQGMWEFWDSADRIPAAIRANYSPIDAKGIRARDPVLDVREGTVAIDFGTSSTVVAIRQHGDDELLRIGLQASDLKRNEIQENDYENPTILELLDIQKLLESWHSDSYRPLVDWNDVHCSHEARTRLRTNDTDPVIVGSMFARLKQWALRDANQARVRITDPQKYEYEFDVLTKHNPVKGQALKLDKNYPQLDPIELYAWFLGMAINHRDRGIFLNYYMTFPVAYPVEVKEKILASFRRGLQRSLPERFVYSEKFDEFSVQELASEPAAFAAAALRTLEIEPTKDGVAYAVFDFGGGTTDFDYGIYREANDEEFDEGFDDVIEHFGSSGDKFLGGENLLENLAYLVFKDNKETCRKHEIRFTKPIDAKNFAGSDGLISQTQAAYTNTTLMMSKLRPLWEAGKIDENSSGSMRIKMIDRHGKPVDVEWNIDQEALLEYLEQRILAGFVAFFTAMKASFLKQLNHIPDTVHILLGGNSSRSRIVSDLLDLHDTNDEHDDARGDTLHDLLLVEMVKIFDEDEFPYFEVHLPLKSDPNDPYRPNTKTGVALGLLKVANGETFKVINHASESNSDSPFQFYVGTHRRDKLVVGIKRGDQYGEWKELGRIRNGVFPLLYTTLPQAESAEGMMRGKGAYEQNITFSGNDSQGKSVFARIIAPDTIELGVAESLEQAQQNIQAVRQIVLKI